MRAFLALGFTGLMLLCFTFSAVADGKLGDAAESAAAGVVLIGAAVLYGQRYVFKDRKHARVSELLTRTGKDR